MLWRSVGSRECEMMKAFSDTKLIKTLRGESLCVRVFSESIGLFLRAYCSRQAKVSQCAEASEREIHSRRVAPSQPTVCERRNCVRDNGRCCFRFSASVAHSFARSFVRSCWPPLSRSKQNKTKPEFRVRRLRTSLALSITTVSPQLEKRAVWARAASM